jgi:hypothetical protein
VFCPWLNNLRSPPVFSLLQQAARFLFPSIFLLPSSSHRVQGPDSHLIPAASVLPGWIITCCDIFFGLELSCNAIPAIQQKSRPGLGPCGQPQQGISFPAGLGRSRSARHLGFSFPLSCFLRQIHRPVLSLGLRFRNSSSQRLFLPGPVSAPIS